MFPFPKRSALAERTDPPRTSADAGDSTGWMESERELRHGADVIEVSDELSDSAFVALFAQAVERLREPGRH